MSRISLTLALIGALVATGCGAGTKPSSGTAGGQGVVGKTFTVVVQNGQEMHGAPANPTLRMKGGWVSSSPSAIDCGGTSRTACSADFAVNTSVTLTANPTGTDPDNGLPYQFLGWAGDCAGDSTCSLSGASDKYVVAIFSGKKSFHPNYSLGTVHGPAYFNRATGLDCYSCHGAQLEGQGIAVSCGMCHVLRTVDGKVLPDGLKSVAAKPTIVFTPAPPMTGTVGSAATFGALATDPIGNPVTCSWSLASKPANSTVTLASSGTCSGTPGSASITPDLAGSYVVRVTSRIGTLETTVLVSAQALPSGGQVGAPEAAPGAELAAIAARLDAVLAIAKNTITADALATRLMNPKNTAQTAINVVDVRDPEDFAKGHIPGAINVPLGQLPSVLLTNPGYLPSSELAIASYNGGDGNMATLLINAVRYNGATIPGFALGIMGGMTTWSFDRELSPTRFDDDNGVRRIENGATVTSAAAPTTPTYGYPSIGAFAGTGDDVAKKILVRADAYLKSLEQEAAAAGVPHREAFWTTFLKYNALKDTADAPLVLSVRSAADYNAKGHVPGAVNIPWGAVAKLGVQTKLVDPSRKVFVYCYTGHTGGQATMALGIMGYQSRNLLYGLNGWTSNVNALGAATSLQNFDLTRAFDFPQHDWPGAPATLVGYNPPRTGCKACHTSQTAQWYDLIVKPLAGPTIQVASEGEG